MFYLKVNDKLYPATFTGKKKDSDWNDRESKTITLLKTSYEEAKDIMKDDVAWSIYEVFSIEGQAIDPETGEPMYKKTNVMMTEDGDLIYDEDGHIQYEMEPVIETTEGVNEYDNSEFSILGDTIIAADGTVSIKMGKPTDLELAYELLYGGV